MTHVTPRKRLGGAVAAAVLILSSAAGTAFAATVTQEDPVGDAAAKFDIVRVTYSNNAAAFRYRMRLRDITRRDGTLVFPKLLINGTWERFFQVTSGARRDGTRFHRLIFASPSRYGPVYCPGMTGSVDFAADVVTARVPQACLSRVGYGHRRYVAIGYAATPGMSEAGDSVRARWVNYD